MAHKLWIEITNRRDIGANLNAPAYDKNGEPHWSYELVREIQSGDLVYHYDTRRQAIVGASTAVGAAWPDKVVWAARGSASRLIEPHLQDGWYLGLEGFTPLPEPLTSDQLSDKREALFALRDRLAKGSEGSLKFPFIPYPPDRVRAFQAYLTKVPEELLALFPVLQAPAKSTDRPARVLGGLYRPADAATSVGERDPFEVDPAMVERALRSHATTQNALAQLLESNAVEPFSPVAGGPLYDLAWHRDGVIYVAEVKSRTDENEERQLRLGLGQVLRYRQMLSADLGAPARAVLVLSSAPKDHSWTQLCEALDVQLCWPPDFAGLDLLRQPQLPLTRER